MLFGGDEGSTTYSDYFSYDLGTSSWTSYTYTADVPLFASVFFEINGKGYVGSGQFQGVNENAFYEITDPNATDVTNISNSMTEISVFPNPFHESATLSFQNSLSNELKIIDSFGKEVRTLKIEPGSENINLDRTGLASGMYSYQLWNETSVIASGKLIVK